MDNVIELKYLCEIETNVKSPEDLKHFLTYNKKISFGRSSDRLGFFLEDQEYELFYKIIKIEDAKKNYFILHISSDDIDTISNFDRLVKLIVKNIGGNNVLLLKDGISHYYSCIAYGRLHKLENEVRALLTEVMCFFGNNNWVEKKAKEILNIERKGVNDSNVLYSRNFDQLEKFLFTEYSSYSHKELLLHLLENSIDLKKIPDAFEDTKSKLPMSIWEKHFKEFSRKVGIEGEQLQKLLKNVYDSRNHIAHCNTFHKTDYLQFESDCNKIETAVNAIVELIENNELSTIIEESEIEDSLNSPYLDTIVVPAQRKGFEEVFMGENQWYEIRISNKKIDDIKYIAAYQVAPDSAITYYAEVKEIVEADENIYKKKVIFKEPAQKLPNPIKLGKNSNLAPQSARYISFDQLNEAETLDDLFG